MSRAGYSDDCDGWQLIMWRGQVASAIRGKRGQAFLRDLIDALDVLPEKRLIADNLAVTPADTYGPPTRVEYYRERSRPTESGVCAIGSVGLRRGVDMSALDPDNYNQVGNAFGIAHQLAQEVVWLNDEAGPGTYDAETRKWTPETPEARWQRVRDWVAEKLIERARADG